MANSNFSFDNRISAPKYVSSFLKNKSESHDEKIDKIKEAMEQEADGGSGVATTIDTPIDDTINNVPEPEINNVNLSELENLDFGEINLNSNKVEEPKSNFDDLSVPDLEVPELDVPEEPVVEKTNEFTTTNTGSKFGDFVNNIKNEEVSKVEENIEVPTEDLSINNIPEEIEEPVVEETQKFVKEDEVEDLIDKAIDNSLIIKSGNYYVIKDKEENRMHGRSEVVNYFCENSNEYFELKQRIESNDSMSENTYVSNVSEMDHSTNDINDSKESISVHNDAVHTEVMQYVCDQTIKNLLETYKSEMYTEKYTSNLFQKYLDREIDHTNPMFKELIEECITKEVSDPYLGELTIKVLTYIKGGN